MVSNDSIPWHAKPLRLAQINLNEMDPQRLDVEQWISYLSQSKVDVLSFNVGGAVAFYPSTLHGHNITPFLGSRDPVQELTSAAREKGMKVLARLDFNRTKGVLYYEHPDWFTIDHHGKPVMHYGFYDACPSGPYYSEFMPSVIRESWSATVLKGSLPSTVTIPPLRSRYAIAFIASAPSGRPKERPFPTARNGTIRCGTATCAGVTE